MGTRTPGERRHDDDDNETHGPRGGRGSGLDDLGARRGSRGSAHGDPRRARSGRGEAGGALVFTGGRGAQTVSAGNSPFTVQPPAAVAASDKVKGLVGSVTDFLSGKQKDLAYLPLSVRSVRPPRV